MNSLTKLFSPSGVLHFSNLHPDFQKSMPQAEWESFVQTVPEFAVLLYTAFLRGLVGGINMAMRDKSTGILTMLTVTGVLTHVESAINTYKLEVESTTGLPANLNVKDN